MYIQTSLPVLLYTTEIDMTLHFIYKTLAVLKNIYTIVWEIQETLFYSFFHFNLMVTITAVVLASTLVDGLQHNQIHVIET